MISEYVYRGKRTFSEEFVVDSARNSKSKREMLIAMKLPIVGSYGYRVLNYFIDLYSIEVGHFAGSERNRVELKLNATPLHEILTGLHPRYNTGRLKMRMLRDGIIERKCNECGITDWRGLPAPLDLDHINGKSWDHNRDNLQLLCRNCHAQTPTFCGKNIKPSAKFIAKQEKATAKQNEIIIRNHEREIYNDKLISLVVTSGIDFDKFGWVTELAPIISKSPQKVNPWMKKFMPDFLSNCFQRGKR